MFLSTDRFCVSLMTLALVGCTSGAELTTPKISLASDRVVDTAGAPQAQLVNPDQTVIETSGEEYFSEGKYGVKASPRVANVTALAMNGNFNERGSSLVSYAGQAGLAPPQTRLKRGGGRAQIGKPYTIRGRKFVPRKQPNYNATGYASWYGSAFHGRLTANGEVYDMNHLSAAHPTLPLPSYVRVTNPSNGRSVIVRVNDRGPFAKNRIIDLSRRAALALGTTKAGVAKVNVKYVGPAPVHGQDDAYLLASYKAPGVRSNTDRVIAALPQSIFSENNPVAIRRPATPLSFAANLDADIQSPYNADTVTIFVPKSRLSLDVAPELGEVETSPEGVFITLNKLVNANETLTQFWRQGHENAMFIRK